VKKGSTHSRTKSKGEKGVGKVFKISRRKKGDSASGATIEGRVGCERGGGRKTSPEAIGKEKCGYSFFRPSRWGGKAVSLVRR